MMSFSDNNRLSRAEVGILLYLLLSAFRVCLLPALLADTAGESEFYVVLAGLAVDFAVCAGALAVAHRGGLEAMPWPSALKRALGAVLAVFFLFKMVLHTYEAVQFCEAELFDQAMPLLLAAVFVLTAALLSVKGYTGIARTGLMFMLIIVFLLLFSAFFVEFGGYGYNLWTLLRPRGVGGGLLRSAQWVGDGAVFLLADTRCEHRPKGHILWAVVAAVAVLLTLSWFYLNFIYTYGSAGRYVQIAFLRMLTNGDPEELGAVDWPIMLVWLMSVPLCLATLFHAGLRGARLAVAGMPKAHYVLTAVLVAAVMTAYCLLFRHEDGFDALTQAEALSYVSFGFAALSAALGVAALCRRTEEATHAEE